MKRITECLAILAVIASLGGHWAILQGVAWTAMLARYSQNMPLRQAVAFTLDGQHPCKLCQAVETGRQAERETQEKLLVQKFDAYLPTPLYFVFLDTPPANVETFINPPPARTDQPLIPPPRFL